MTLIACPIAVRPPVEIDALEGAVRDAALAGANLIEWRFDALAGTVNAEQIAVALVARSPLPCIATCRPASEGGAHAGPEGERLEIFEALAGAESPPRFMDVELTSLELGGRWAEVVERFRARGDAAGGVILSSHDLDGRPPDLLRRVEAMTRDERCSVVKIVWRARSLRDNLEAFDLLAERRKPMIALCLGEFGLMSRVLAPKFGGFLTFAAAGPGLESAPGQPEIDVLREQYRFDSIGIATRVYGVIGWPVAHSLGPVVHNAGFTAVGHDGVYLPMPIPPEYEHFKATVATLLDAPQLGFAGASVTVPHKENLLRLARERGAVIDPLVERVGAANTLTVESDGTLVVRNTDVPAAIEAIVSGMRIDAADLAEKSALILGAGGVARAVGFALAEAGARVTVAARTFARARTLARDIGERVAAARIEDLGGERYDLIVNATPLGMRGGPAPTASPLPEGIEIDGRTTVFDTVYTPPQTPLLREAEERGARTIPGFEMFIAQARMQFEQWTGKPLPIEAARRPVEGAHMNPSPRSRGEAG